MVFPDCRGDYGTLVPNGRLSIWYFFTVEATIVLLCHLAGCPYGISYP
jgi:hypothetical protein